MGLLEAAGLRETEEDGTAISKGAHQDIYWQGDDKIMESRHGSPLPSMQTGAHLTRIIVHIKDHDDT